MEWQGCWKLEINTSQKNNFCLPERHFFYIDCTVFVSIPACNVDTRAKLWGTGDPSNGIYVIYLADLTHQLLPSTSSLLTRGDFYRRFQTQTKPAGQTSTDAENHEAGLKAICDSADPPSQTSSNDSSYVKHEVISKLKTSPRHDLAMIFTCSVCETRSIKTACRESYEKGVVVARCGGCNNLHLISDHLGWFGVPGSIEDFLAARGEEVRKGSVDTLNLTLDDIAGKKIVQE